MLPINMSLNIVLQFQKEKDPFASGVYMATKPDVSLVLFCAFSLRQCLKNLFCLFL